MTLKRNGTVKRWLDVFCWTRTETSVSLRAVGPFEATVEMDLAQAVSQLISVVADLIAKNDRLQRELAAASWGYCVQPCNTLFFPTPQAEASAQTLVNEVGRAEAETQTLLPVPEARGAKVGVSAPDPFTVADPWKSYKSVSGAENWENPKCLSGPAEKTDWQPVSSDKERQKRAEIELVVSQARAERDMLRKELAIHEAELTSMGAAHGESGSSEAVSSAVLPDEGAGKVQSKNAAVKAKAKKKHKKHRKNSDDDDACLEAAFQEARQNRQPGNFEVAVERAFVADNALKKCGGFKAPDGEHYKIKILTEDAMCGMCGYNIAAPSVAGATATKYVTCLSSCCVPRFMLEALDAEAASVMSARLEEKWQKGKPR